MVLVTRRVKPNPTMSMMPGKTKPTHESPRHYIEQLSLKGPDRSRSDVLEVRIHARLDKIAVFERNRSENSLQWLICFIYKMKGTRMPNDS